MTVRILTGDCRAMLLTLPDESVHCCVTSPPYFGLRDYGHDGQIGLERSPMDYVSELADVFNEVFPTYVHTPAFFATLALGRGSGRAAGFAASHAFGVLASGCFGSGLMLT